MKTHLFLLIAILLLILQGAVPATGLAGEGGRVSVEVDRSKAVWAVTITNHGAESLSYEMFGKLPRELGMELWEPDVQDSGIRLHAGDLALSADMDVFPGDFRELLPGKKVVFQLDPREMSTKNATTLAKWKRAERIGYYECRVVFGVHASPLIRVSPAEKPPGVRPAERPKFPSPEAGAKDELIGIRLRRMLEEKGLALVSSTRGTDEKGEYYVEYTTCKKADLESMAAWNEPKPTEPGLHQLVETAQTVARKRLSGCNFDSLIIERCEDDDSKRYASIWFSTDQDDIVIDLLLNGAPTETKKLGLTEEQYKELSEYGIPKLPEQPAALPSSKPEGGDKPQPEAEGHSR